MKSRQRTSLMGRLRVVTVAGVMVLFQATPASAAVTLEGNPVSLANAVAEDPGIITGAAFVTSPPAPSTALASDVGGFAQGAGQAIVLSTGDPLYLDQPNNSTGTTAVLNGPNIRGNTDLDVTILRIDLLVPNDANCLSFEFRFLSEEYPEFVGTEFNDAFMAELDSSTWTTNGSTISAPNNFAFDPLGNEVSINATGVASVSPGNAVGTTFDAATARVSAVSPITPGSHSLYLSIFDQGDPILDSAVIIDKLQVGTVDDLSRCVRGLVSGEFVFFDFDVRRFLESDSEAEEDELPDTL